MSIHEKAEWLRKKVIEFKKVIENLGILMAKTDYVIGMGPNTSEPSIFAVTERIDGENLRNIEHIDKETAEKIDELFARIISKLIDSFLKDEYFWYDPGSSQFMLGKAEGDTKPSIYLVDVDPHVWKWGDPALNMEKAPLFLYRINFLLHYIEEMETKVKVDVPGFKFAKSREALESIKTKMAGLI